LARARQLAEGPVAVACLPGGFAAGRSISVPSVDFFVARGGGRAASQPPQGFDCLQRGGRTVGPAPNGNFLEAALGFDISPTLESRVRRL